jgi:anhydro-N-acetylmuramic acid kinase
MYCIGLISGTSVDGIDAVLVEITGVDFDLQVTQIAGATFAYPDRLREQILAVCSGASLSMPEFAQLDDAIATQFALAAQKIQKGHPTAQLIGSHGQTVFHRPPVGVHSVRPNNRDSSIGYSLQLGRGAVIAELTGIPVASNFRAADIAAGGEGAPLVSKIDVCLLSHPTLDRCVQNLGGIGNVTYLPARNGDNWEQNICGWDTGPGNALIDLAVSKLTDGKLTFDKDGSWAARGTPVQELVERWLQQDFFQQSPPKSTGRELFSPDYLNACWQEARAYQLSDADWLATLTELTVASVVHSYQTFLPRMPDEVLLCGGGSRNRYLKQRLEARLAGSSRVLTTDEAGVNGDFKEAIAFAVLAYWRFHCSFAGNLPQVTGAKQPVLLGEINLPITN